MPGKPYASPRNSPKFWDGTKKRVVAGVEIRKTLTQLADILGTYVWVFSGDRESPEDLEQTRRGDYTDDEAFISKYSITLSAANNRPGQPVAPEDVSGRVNFWELWVAFEGVRGAREGWSSDGAIMESFWEVLLTENHEEDEDDIWLDEKGNAVGVAVALDDNGSPFLVFDWHHPPAPRCAWSGYYVGKRLVEGKDWRLTDEERGRLGIGATFRSVEQLFKEGSPGVYREDYGEEGGEKAVVKKRKASTDETGAKKMKASTDETSAKKGKASTDETDPKKGKASTDETGAEKKQASTDGTGSKKRRKRRRRRASMVPGQ